MFKHLTLASILFVLLPTALPVQASNVSINVPGISINIGDRDRRGYHWDGYDWRDSRWWNSRGQRYGERNHRGYYWDGGRWQNKSWWHKNNSHQKPRYYGYKQKNNNYKHNNYKHNSKRQNQKDRGRDHRR